MSEKTLSTWVFEDTKKSGIDESTICEMRIFEPEPEALKGILGFDILGSKIGATYAIPYADGYIRVKLQNPLGDAKYLSPKNRIGKHLYYLPSEKDNLQSCKYSVILTEGEKKTAKLTQECRKLDHITALGAPGIGMFPLSPEEKQSFIAVLQRLSERIFYIALDSDFCINPDVQNAIAKLTTFLSSYGAIPKLVIWNTNYKGIDDYLTNFKSNPEEELKKILVSAIDNPFEYLKNLSIEKFCEIITQLGLTIQKAELIFDKYNLKKILQISKTSFKSLLKTKLQDSKAEAKQKQIQEFTQGQKIDESGFFEKEGKTYQIIDGNFDTSEKIVADFTARFTKEIINDDGDISREIEIKKGSVSKCLELSGDDLSEVQNFRKAINRKIIVSYEPTITSFHNRFREFIEQKSKMANYKKTQYLGMIEEGFLFHNVLVKKAGKVIPIESSGLMPSKPENGRKMLLGDHKSSQKILQEFFENVYKIFGNQTWKAIGWAIATLFSNGLFEKFSIFPLLFLYGRRGAGKSNGLARWISALFGTHKALEQFNLNTTQKAMQRAGAKYKNCPVIINEFKSTEQNNTMLCSMADRQGYGRAKKDNSLDLIQGEINASFVVISTLNLIGSKSEDAISRMVEINFNEVTRNEQAFNWIQDNLDSLSCFVPFMLENIIEETILESIDRYLPVIRKNAKLYEDRQLKNHTVIYACYLSFLSSIFGNDFDSIKKYALDMKEIAKAISFQTECTKQSDLGLTFLNMAIAMVRNKKIEDIIAKIQTDNMGNETLLFSLSDILPYVRQQGKASEITIADERTIANSLRILGCDKKQDRALTGNPQKIWRYKIQTEKDENVTPDFLDNTG